MIQNADNPNVDNAQILLAFQNLTLGIEVIALRIH